MNEHPYRAGIPPVPNSLPRPFWSVMIPTYNSAEYLRQTLENVLVQDPGAGSMQIEVVDDCSTEDDPGAVVAELGQGRVEFFRQVQNVGHTKNFETCLKKARGHVVHLLHSDDYVRPGFYQKLKAPFEKQPGLGAAFCRQIFMDEHGNWQSLSPLEQKESGILVNWLERIPAEQCIMTPSIVVRREVYERLGGFDTRLVCSEDWEMWVRIAACYPIWYEAEPLAVYRMHSNSNTGRHIRTAEDTRYTRLAIDIFKEYLPAADANRLSGKARETYALAALETALNLAWKKDFQAMKEQIREALLLSRSIKVLLRLGWVLLGAGRSFFRRLRSAITG